MIPIDFDRIVNELEQGLQNAAGFIERFGHKPTLYGPEFFHEFRTVGFRVPRQMGKTYWLMQKVVENKKLLAVLRDERFVWTATGNYARPHGSSMPEEAVERVITLDQLRQRIKDGTLGVFEIIAVDDASHCFHFVKSQLFKYFWTQERWDMKFWLIG
jgi:hypothetical protein